MTFNDPLVQYLGEWSAGMNFYSVAFRVILVVILASLIGTERLSKRHSAGLRTFIIVSLSSAVSAMIDVCMISKTQMGLPIISAASVVSIAMISGNSILFSSKSQIKGLTTSAGLWGCGMVGLATGAGLYTIALIAFVALLCCISKLSLRTDPTTLKYCLNSRTRITFKTLLQHCVNLASKLMTLNRIRLT